MEWFDVAEMFQGRKVKVVTKKNDQIIEATMDSDGFSFDDWIVLHDEDGIMLLNKSEIVSIFAEHTKEFKDVVKSIR
jgi:hypothetical protein